MSDVTKVISIDSPIYPSILRNVLKPPTKLYVRGNIKLLSHERLLAVVGSRKATNYGQQCIGKLLTPVVQANIPLVSGLAYGIDSMAHKLCVDNNQPTIAVLGSGIDDKHIYPREHLKLAHNIIASGGALISEHPDGTAPNPKHFPARNRLIAGLGQATLVVQAAIRSGSLITARLSLEMGKDVYAVPGAITDILAEGTNQLISQGATPIIIAQDILDLYGLTAPKMTRGQQLKLQQ